MRLIIAGTREQARILAEARGWANWRYVHSVDDLKGRRGWTVSMYGTYSRRSDWLDVYDEMRNQACIPEYEPDV